MRAACLAIACASLAACANGHVGGTKSVQGPGPEGAATECATSPQKGKYR